MHSPFHPKQCPWYSVRLYYVSYISCRTFTRNRGLKASPGIICIGCQEGDQGWTNRKHEEYWVFVDKIKPTAFLKDPLLKEFGSYSSRVEINYEQWLDSKQDTTTWKHIYTTAAVRVIFVTAFLHYFLPYSISDVVFSFLFSWFFSGALSRFFGARSEYSQRLLLTGITNFKKS